MTSATHADLILTNGRIYTVDTARPWAQAVAIGGGRILAVGSTAEIEAYRTGETEVVDLGGRMAMPGFVDVHNHIMMGGQADLFETQLPAGASVDDICAHVRRQAEAAVPGQWIIANQWGADMITALNSEASLAKLDAASLGHPVLLRDETMHNRWVNSVALQMCGIANDQPDPPAGSFGRDPATGRLTGLLVESAAGIVERVAADHFTEAMGEAAIARAVEIVNSYGVTAFQDAASVLPIMKALTGLDNKGKLTAWAVTSLPLIEPSFMFGLSGDELLALRDEYRTRHVRPNFTKIFLDGVPGARTSAFHDAYLDDGVHPRGYRGETLVTYPDLVQHIDKSEKLGMGLKIHCTGDYAVTEMLDAVEAVRHFNGPAKVMHHIAHASYVRPQDVERFAKLSVVADLSPMMWYPTTFLEGHKEAMGDERATRFWPIADLHKSGALLAGGSDWPVIPVPDPWTGIEGMVTRQNPSGAFPGVALWPEQAIDLATAIRIFTLNSAIAMGIGEETGSIEPGKSADIIVLDQQVFDVAPDRIADTKVLTTYFAGRAVYQR
ncbi:MULTISPECIES: amidohydrolase [unclassified Brucella]|uniref:amidohydrolase n=1 Tax=unclassified Brucella TaxID=2632610 RepID=UPI00217DB07D|nr:MULTISPECIES: amidohydrolase [unclassified Brucella]UWF67823.1 amidohydrolase [Brucella sp. 1315]UWF70943.1 amidohydrolase [Brucella sp. 2594]